MTFTAKLAAATSRHDSLLCVGLDPDIAKFPAALQGKSDAIFLFCKAIIDAHGGQIDATDQASGGACLRFTLPMGTAPALDDEALVLARGELS